MLILGPAFAEAIIKYNDELAALEELGELEGHPILQLKVTLDAFWAQFLNPFPPPVPH
jgi:hypothetical protein